MANITWDTRVGIFNIITVVILYMITYKTLDKKTAEREKNKNEISIFLIIECYKACLEQINILEVNNTVEKFIIPKIDPNSTDNTMSNHIQNRPFFNEHIIVDLVKDGQISKRQIEGYFKIKRKYCEYIDMRIIFFDHKEKYKPLKVELIGFINNEINKMKKLYHS